MQNVEKQNCIVSKRNSIALSGENPQRITLDNKSETPRRVTRGFNPCSPGVLVSPGQFHFLGTRLSMDVLSEHSYCSPTMRFIKEGQGNSVNLRFCESWPRSVEVIQGIHDICNEHFTSGAT